MDSFWVQFIMSSAPSVFIAAVKNPESMKRWKAVLYKVAAVIYAAAEGLGEAEELDRKIDIEIAKAKVAPSQG